MLLQASRSMANGHFRFRIWLLSTVGLLQNNEVEVDISHTFIGDLVIELVSPNDTSVLLHNRTGGLADNIFRTYTAGNTSGLQALQGETFGGTWKLRVSDHASQDQGKLNRWALNLT